MANKDNGDKRDRALLKAHPQFELDIEALCSYGPRNQAIQWLSDGDVETYLDWALGDGYWAAHAEESGDASQTTRRSELFNAIPLDRALIGKRLEGCAYAAQEGLIAIAMKKVGHLMQSPLEIVLRQGSVEAFDLALRAWSSPERRFADPLNRAGECLGWSSLHINAESVPALKMLARKWFAHSLIPLAFMLGREDHLKAMIRHGMHPVNGLGWHALAIEVANLCKVSSHDLELASGFDLATWESAARWTASMAKRVRSTEEIASSKSNGSKQGSARQAIEAIQALLDQGTAVSQRVVEDSTRWGDEVWLRSLFAKGGNSNSLNEVRVQSFAGLDTKSLKKEAAQVWLEHGANPTLGEDSEGPFGTRERPSAIYKYIEAGRLDLLRLAAAKSLGPIAFNRVVDGQTYAQPLALALSNGRKDIVQWLIEEQGCSLDHLEEETGEPCREYGEGDVLAAAMAAEERVAIGDLPQVLPGTRKPPL